MQKISLILIIITCSGLSGCSSRFLSTSEKEDICQQYDWSGVEQLVSPHLDNLLMSALTMQGQSANYQPSMAASQAIGDVKDENVRAILQRIIDANCE